MTILQLSFLWILTRSQWVGFLLGAVSRHSSTQHFQARWVQDSPDIGSFHPAQLRSLVWDPFLAVLTSLDQTLDFTWEPSLSPTFSLRCKDFLEMHRKQVEGIVTATRDLAASGLIDPVEEMARDQVILSKENNFPFFQVFIFQGHKDPIVPWSNAGLIHQFYSAFAQEQNIDEKSDLQATHGMVGANEQKLPLFITLPRLFQPSDSYGCTCDTLCPYFYINNCHYNGAAAVIQKVVSNFLFAWKFCPPLDLAWFCGIK